MRRHLDACRAMPRFVRQAHLLALALLGWVALEPALASDLVRRNGPVGIPDTGRVHIADLNRDGLLDLVIAAGGSFSDSKVASHVALGARTFERNLANYISFGSTFASELADVDGDGFPDLLLVFENDSRLYHATGNGDGTFATSLDSIETNQEYPRSLVVGEFNGDGLDDVVLIHGTGRLYLLLNDGAGSFLPPVWLRNSSPLVSVQPHDIDVDGRMDLFVTWGDDAVVLFGNGDGTFAEVVPFPPLASDIRRARVIDWNGDSNTDIVVSSSSSIVVYLGDDRRGFSAGPSYPEPSATFEVGDFDGDSRADLVTIGSTSALIFLGREDGEIVVSRETVQWLGFEARSVLARDIDLDGRSDWIITDGSTQPESFGTRIVFGHAATGVEDLYVWTGGAWKNPLVAADFNGDGVDDIDVGEFVLFGTRSGELVRGPDHAVVSARRSFDIDGNGSQDLIGTTSTSVEILLNDGAGNFQPGWSHSGLLDPVAVHVGQVNDEVDDIPDLIVLEPGANAVRPFFGNGDGTFTAGPPADAGGASPEAQAVGDFDEDGHLDVAVFNHGFVRVRRGNGFIWSEEFLDLAVGGNPVDLKAVDVNSDGHLDLLYVTSFGIHFRAGDGNLDFAPAWTQPLDAANGFRFEAARVRDLDRDGHVDLMATTDSLLYVFAGNGSDFDAPSITWCGISNHFTSNFVTMSFDDDPVRDIVVGGRPGFHVLLSRAYDPSGCVAGNVNGGVGPPRNVLFVNDSAGVGSQRTLRVSRNAPLEIRMEAPPSLRRGSYAATATSPFVLYSSSSSLERGEVRPLSISSSPLCFPSPITEMNPSNIMAIWNNLGDEGTFGMATEASSPAPSVLVRTHDVNVPGLVGSPMQVILQGLIRDRNAPSGDLAVTNAVLLIVD